MFRADRLLEELERHAPEVLAAATASWDKSIRDLDFVRLDEEAFEAAPSISIDYAIMEKADNLAVMPYGAGWSDLGGWDAVWREMPKDQDGNAISEGAEGIDCENTLIRSEDAGFAVVGLGLKDTVVVATGDAVLVARSDRTAEVKDLVAGMAAAGKKQASEHPMVYRPWGSYQDIDAGTGFRVKRLIVKPGATLSLQRHKYRSEHWVVVTGVAKVTRGEQILTLQENESTFIPATTIHRLENPGEEALHLIEVQVGSYVGEDDIERLEDTYGRA